MTTERQLSDRIAKRIQESNSQETKSSLSLSKLSSNSSPDTNIIPLDKKIKITYTNSIHRAWRKGSKCCDEQRIIKFKDVKSSLANLKKRLKEDMCDFLVPSKLNDNDYESLMDIVDKRFDSEIGEGLLEKKQ